MSLNLEAIKGLPLADLMALRVAVNNRVAEVEAEAAETIGSGKKYPGFEIQPGKISRCVKNQKAYEALLKRILAHEATETKFIALTKAEKLIKDRFEDEDDELEEIMEEFNKTLGTKQAADKLVYVGDSDE